MKDKILEYFNQDFLLFYGQYLSLTPHKQNGENFLVLCPFHKDTKPSFSFNQKSGLSKCFGCGFEGDIFSFYAKLKGLNTKTDFPQILSQIAFDCGIEKPVEKKVKRKLVATYDYTDEMGSLLYQVVRYLPKDFRQRRPDGKGGWIWSLEGAKRVLYRLPEILKSDYVIVVEGEKDTDNLFKIGLIATTNFCGANKWEGLQKKYDISEPLRNKDVIILPDNDPEGEEDAQMKAHCLQGIAKSIKVLNLPDLPHKADASDFIEKYNDPVEANERLCQMIESCESWKPKPDQDPVEEECLVMSVNDLLRTEFEYKTPVIAEGILPQQAGMILAGEGGVGKSLISLEWIIRLVMGWKILDIDVPTSRIIKIFQTENTMEQIQFRLRKILTGFQIANLPNKIFFSKPVNLGEKSSIKKIKDEVRECDADIFVIDPLSSFHQVNENDNILIRGILDKVTEISRETGAAATVIDHFNKPSADRWEVAYRVRGAMSKRDWADTVICITQRKHEHKILRQLDFIKIRNGPMRKSVLVERDENFIHEIVEEDMLVPVSRVKEILETQFGGRVEKQRDLLEAIAQECGCTQRTAAPAIRRAVTMKFITEFKAKGRAKGYCI